MAKQKEFVPASELPDLVSAAEYVKRERYDTSDKKFDLTDRVAIVGGSSRGIGRAIALGFAEYGAKVVVCSRKQKDLEFVSEQIKEMGGEALAISANYGKKQDILNLVDTTLKRFGRIDILVNNVFTAPIYGPFVETTTEEAWDKMMDVNLKGYYIACQAVAPIMKKQGKGNIINIGTVGALHHEPGMGCYSICKAGVLMLTRVLAAELAKDGIRTNCILPGLVNTFMSQALIKSKEFMERFADLVPMGRMAEPDEFVGISVFLASDASSYVNGAIIPVDGGSIA